MSEIDKDYIEKRLEDWLQRLDAVFSLVKKSLADFPEVEFFENKKVQMNEELMQEFSVSPISLPVLEVKRKGKLVASFKPIGLWVIGANGRVDILTEEGSYILVDMGGKENPSDWQVYTPRDRKRSVHFNEEFVKELI